MNAKPAQATQPVGSVTKTSLEARFAQVRAQTEALARPLSAEDCQAQSMPDASPVKWHLAHVTWFFETFILERFESGYLPHNPAFRALFNSYYNGVGAQHPRPQRGLLSRPSMQEVLAWRRAVNERILRLGARLPTEFEWEAAVAIGVGIGEGAGAGTSVATSAGRGNFAESRALHPMPVARLDEGLLQTFGDVWEWTSSSYSAYPGCQPWAGAVGEYNGKFMANQYVLRGGSCATPASHIRATYRNFFPADARWQFSGLRLARDRP